MDRNSRGLDDTDRRVYVVVISLAIASIAAYQLWTGGYLGPRHGVRLGERAVNIVVDGLDNSRFILRSHRGEVVVLVFITTRCGSCRSQINELKQLHEAFNGVVIATIDIDVGLDPSDLEALAAEKEIPWFVGHSTEAGLIYGVYFVPTIVVVDGNGIISYRGLYTPFERLRLIVQQIM